MKKNIIINTLIISGIIIFIMLRTCAKSEKPHTLGGEALGTFYSIRYFNDKNINELIENKIDSIIRQINQSMSTYLPNSIISKINNGNDSLITDTHFQFVFNEATKIWQDTDGYFDPSTGLLVNAYNFGTGSTQSKNDGQPIDSLMPYIGWNKFSLTPKGRVVKPNKHCFIDFNGIAKGYAVDLLGHLFKELKISAYLIEIGGEIVAGDKNPITKQAWKIGIANPLKETQKSHVQIVSVENRALATSGNYRKFYTDSLTNKKLTHLINPKTGSAEKTRVLSASVLAPNCITADGWATALMLMPVDKSMAAIEKKEGMEACIITLNHNNELEYLFSGGWPSVK